MKRQSDKQPLTAYSGRTCPAFTACIDAVAAENVSLDSTTIFPKKIYYVGTYLCAPQRSLYYDYISPFALLALRFH